MNTPLRTFCPFCMALGLSHESRDGSPPAVNDLSVCASCSEVSIFEVGERGLQLREPTPDEQEIIDTDINIQRARRTMRAAKTEEEKKQAADRFFRRQ